MKILDVLTPKRRLGNWGEQLAVKDLKKHGYKILARNYVAHGHEIDIIAENKDYVIFVEVKTRSTLSEDGGVRPALSVTPEKQRKIISAATYYYKFLDTKKMLRFDVIEIYKHKNKTNINHMKGAFNANSAKERRQ